MKPTANAIAGLLMLMTSLPALAGPGTPDGWTSLSKPGEYDFGTEHVEGAEGRQSAYIKANPGATPDASGTMGQVVKADSYIGERVRLSAQLRSDAAKSLQLWFRIDGADPKKYLAYGNMEDHPVIGTTNWKRYNIVLDVPAGSTNLNFGFALSGGKGEGWADAFRLEKVDESVPVSASTKTSPVNNQPTNLNFDR